MNTKQWLGYIAVAVATTWLHSEALRRRRRASRRRERPGLVAATRLGAVNRSWSPYDACVGWIDHDHELEAIRAWFETRSLDLAVIERPNGTWRAVVMARDGTHGEAEYADGGDEIDAARRARARHSTRRLRVALSGLAEVAQSEVVQLVFAEAVVARLPGGRTRAGRRAALVGTVWMLDPKRRAATAHDRPHGRRVDARADARRCRPSRSRERGAR